MKKYSDMLLEIKDLHASIGDKEILKGVNLRINAGEVHAIMGPNGNGKSTLASVIAGNELFTVTKGEVLYKGKNLLEMSIEERACEGVFLGFQYPVEIPGVSIASFMRTAINEQRKYHGQDPMDMLEFAQYMEEKQKVVELTENLAKRSVNEGFSGGEKKKNEIFQMAMLQPSLAFLDETDSGLDIDALRIVAGGVNQLRREDNAIVVITHYQRLLDYIVPDFVHVLADGRIVKTGPKELALELEERLRLVKDGGQIMSKAENGLNAVDSATVPAGGVPAGAPVDGVFRCDVSDLDTHSLIWLNGRLPENIGARRPDLPWQVYREADDTLVVRVEEGVQVDKPLQIIVLCKKEAVTGVSAVASAPSGLPLSLRVELGRGARLTVVHCIDSDLETEACVQGAVRLELASAARLSWLSLQNINNRCRVGIDLQADVAAGAGLHTCFCSLNGGSLQNEQRIELNGVQAEASALGLYLVDGTQKVYNKVKINHNSPEAHSRQLFKGILDDSASGRFEGHVLVKSGAEKTEAYQTNRNLLLTKKAKFQTKPYLEIYADDVKCSHGATVGQLDEKALFYMRCRGISQATARRLLMYAFAAEVIREVGVAALEDHLTRLVQRRLRGELGACEDCALHCTATKACANLPW